MKYLKHLAFVAILLALGACDRDTTLPSALDYSASNPAMAVSFSGVVTDLAVASKTDTSVTLQFTQKSDNTSFEVRMMAGSTLTWWNATPVARGTCSGKVAGVATGAKLTCTVLGLTPSTLYSFQLVPYRGTLNVNATFAALSNVTSTTTLAPPPPPPPPPAMTAVSNLSVAAKTDTSMTLSFTQVPNGVGGAASYDIRVAEGSMTWWLATSVTAGTCASPLAGTTAGAAMSCTVTGLKASTAYSFQLVAFRGTLNVNAVFSGLSNVASGTTNAAPQAPPPPPPMFFSEAFNDAAVSSRGWYDNTAPAVSSGVLTYHWTPGAQTPASGGALRHRFTASNSLYVAYDVKYSDNFVGSNKSYHPHEFYVLSTMDDDWDGLSNNWMTLYLEQSWSSAGGRPRMSIQDNKAVNTSLGAIPNNLIGVTENRSVASCNGVTEFGMTTECWAFQPWYNLKSANGPVAFRPASGAGYKGNWNRVEAFYQLNTIVNGVSQANGVMQFWFNGQLLIDRHDIVFRTAARASLQLSQLVIAPYIGDGSPVDQTMWIDNLVVGAGRP